MGGILVFGRERPSPIGWRPAELSECYRVVELLARQGLPVALETGRSDEGEPWAVVVREDTGEVLLHLARVGRDYVVAGAGSPTRWGSDLRDVVTAAFRAAPLATLSREAGGKVLLHPATLLAVLIATAWAHSEAAAEPAPAGDGGRTGRGSEASGHAPEAGKASGLFLASSQAKAAAFAAAALSLSAVAAALHGLGGARLATDAEGMIASLLGSAPQTGAGREAAEPSPAPPALATWQEGEGVWEAGVPSHHQRQPVIAEDRASAPVPWAERTEFVLTAMGDVEEGGVALGVRELRPTARGPEPFPLVQRVVEEAGQGGSGPQDFEVATSGVAVRSAVRPAERDTEPSPAGGGAPRGVEAVPVAVTSHPVAPALVEVEGGRLVLAEAAQLLRLEPATPASPTSRVEGSGPGREEVTLGAAPILSATPQEPAKEDAASPLVAKPRPTNSVLLFSFLDSQWSRWSVDPWAVRRALEPDVPLDSVKTLLVFDAPWLTLDHVPLMPGVLMVEDDRLAGVVSSSVARTMPVSLPVGDGLALTLVGVIDLAQMQA